MRIAFFTALKEERAALRAAWPMHDSGSLKGLEFDSGERAVGFCSGIGAERMAAAVETGLRLFQPDLAVLVGFSAALRGDLGVGEAVCEERGDVGLLAALRQYPLPLRFGRVAASGLLRSVEEKQCLAEARPDCLLADMETEAFITAIGSTPHLVLRVVSDDLQTPLPLPFDQLLTARGFPDEKKIVARVAGDLRLVPALLGLAKSTACAGRSLTQTIADVKPLLIRRLLESR